MKNAIVYAEAVTVLCPHCKEPSPAKSNGSFIWTAQDFTIQNTTVCSACKQKFWIGQPKKVRFTA